MIMYKNGKNRTVKTFQKYFQGEVWNAKFRLTGQMYTECLDPPKKSDFGWYFLLVSTENEGGFFQACGFSWLFRPFRADIFLSRPFAPLSFD